MISPYAAELAEASLSLGSIRLQPQDPFRWSSGYYMPIYNDNRMLLASWRLRSLVASAFRELIRREELPCDWIAGTATAGIPHATTLADSLGLPLAYVRGSAKDHGRGCRIEGPGGADALRGRKVLLVEDLISTGGSSIAAINALRQAGAEVSACLAIFSYGLDEAARRFTTLRPPCRMLPILEYDQLVKTALVYKAISPAQQQSLREWRTDPFHWGEQHGYPPERSIQ